MKTLRGLIAAAVLVCASLVPAAESTRSLSFAERVEAQRAIEQIHWNHRIWPKDNLGPKPPLDAVLPEAELRARVTDYLRKSNALAEVWQRPIGAEQLQAEMDRMAESTRAPDVLGEIFAALGSDPYVIAETLARQTLVDRLIRDWYAHDERFHGALRLRAEAALAHASSAGDLSKLGATYTETTWRLQGQDDATQDPKPNEMSLDADEWREKRARADRLPFMKVSDLQETDEAFFVTSVLKEETDAFTEAVAAWPKISFDAWWGKRSVDSSGDVASPGDRYTLAKVATSSTCTPDTWIDTEYVPEARSEHTAVWSGSEMIVWGGIGASGAVNSGGRYTPSTNSWAGVRLAGAPAARYEHTATWTGSEMIVWGGGTPTNAGGRYNPTSDSWMETTTTGAPTARSAHTAVWTGTEMIVWGGMPPSTMSTGGRYNPSTDTWVETTLTDAPSMRWLHTAVWTGSEMIVWGGFGGADVNTGGRYNPSTDRWVATATNGAPTVRESHSAVWTGTEMIVWGGTAANTGGRYSPSTDSWTPTATTPGVPEARLSHTAVWTGTEMIVWGGYTGSTYLRTGARYNPSTNSWVATSLTTPPTARRYHTAVWTGSEMIVWGGGTTTSYWNTGARYSPATNGWVSMTPSNPGARRFHTAVWTGSEMIVWGGEPIDGAETNTGGRYSPSTNNWVATTTTGVPSPRAGHTAVWTGSEMIVWGGVPTTNTGGRYNPSTNTWLATTTSGAPSARQLHTAVWTGSEMIVWGGGTVSYFNTGGRFNPSTNRWTLTATTPWVPSGRFRHTAVWTGSEMIVWGGQPNTITGGRYSPSTDRWTATAETAGVPTARYTHTAIWTGSEMIVWGGTPAANTGGRYSPASDTWSPTAITTGVPTKRTQHSAVWTGTEMIVWGGNSGTSLSEVNTGGRYTPDSDHWEATSVPASVAARRIHTAVWTGSEMIVWGGDTGHSNSELNTGGRYCVPCDSVYRDLDGDGHGDLNVTWSLCDGPAPGNYVGSSDDCNDADSSNFPGNLELCDNRDNDCDGQIEVPGPEACDSRDNDCNGLIDEGIAAQGICASGQPGVCNAGHDECVGGAFACVADRGPGAEICNGLDDDCDGAIDEATDSDGDGHANCSDNCPDAYNPTQTNADADAFGDACDCAVGDATNARAPAVGSSVRLSKADGWTGLTWQDGGGTGPYRLYRGFRNPGSAFAYNQYCTGIAWPTTSASDALIPRAGTLFLYLVSRSGCSESALGYDTANAEIPNGDPCPSTGTDADGDGFEEAVDARPGFSNASQADVDGDQRGDVCDNCPNDANSYQEDMDEDLIGDVCDPDLDGDGSVNAIDNCPSAPNADQADADSDGIGDMCDADGDGDGILEDGDASGMAGDAPCIGGVIVGCDDNCPTVANANQADADANGIGDACQ